MKKLMCKIFWLPFYKNGDNFVFEWLWKFKIIWYYKKHKSYDCYFYEFDKQNIDKKTYTIISEVEIEENILIHKIDSKNKFIFWNNINVEWDWNIITNSFN